LSAKKILCGVFFLVLLAWAVLTPPFICRRTATFQIHSENLYAVAASPDCKTLAVSQYGEITLWDVASCKERVTLKGHNGDVFTLAFSPDGKTLASAGDQDHTIRLWDVAAGKERATLKGHTGYIRAVAFSPDCKTLASGSFDKTIKLWDAVTGKERTTLIGHIGWVHCVAFSPDGATLASGGDCRAVRLWDVCAATERVTLDERPDTDALDYVRCLAFSPDCKTLASGNSDTEVELWDLATGEKLLTLGEYQDELGIDSMAFCAEGKTLVATDGDSVKLWNIANRKCTVIVAPEDQDLPQYVQAFVDVFQRLSKRPQERIVIRPVMFQSSGQCRDPWYWMAWRRPGLYRYLAGIWPGLAKDRTIAVPLIPN
jgi:WD40 repeat protein